MTAVLSPDGMSLAEGRWGRRRSGKRRLVRGFDNTSAMRALAVARAAAGAAQ